MGVQHLHELFDVSLDGVYQFILEVVNVIEGLNPALCFLLVGIEYADGLVCGVEIETTYRSPVVVVAEYGEIRLRVSISNAVRLYVIPQNGLYNIIAFYLLFRSYNLVTAALCCGVIIHGFVRCVFMVFCGLNGNI